MRCDGEVSWLYITLTLVLATTAVTAQPTTRAGDPPGSGLVGKYGDLRKLPIHGAIEISQETIHSALAMDLLLQLNAGPAAPIDQFLQLMQADLTAAYQASGFPSPRIELRLDPRGNPDSIEIIEGTRVRRGPVRIVAPQNFPVDQLKQLLTSETFTRFDQIADPRDGSLTIGLLDIDAAKKKPFWIEGSPAWFGAYAQQNLQNKVREALAEMGYLRPRFTAEVDILPAGNECELVVKLSDPGPPAVLGQIDVVGAKRNTSDGVIAFLGLKRDAPITIRQLQEAQQKLWDTGRFQRHVLIASPLADGRPGALKLTIGLAELPSAAPLDQPAPQVDQILLKTRQWIEGLSESEDEVQISPSLPNGINIDAVLAPKQGIVIRARREADAAQRGMDLAIVAAGERIHLYDAAMRMAQSIPFIGVRPSVSIAMFPDFDAKIGERWRSAKVGMGINSNTADRPDLANPLRFSIFCAPVILLDTAHNAENAFSMDGSVLRGKLGQTTVEIDAASGRIIQASSENLHITTGRGLYAGAIAPLEALEKKPDNNPKQTNLFQNLLIRTLMMAGPEMGLSFGLTPEQFDQVARVLEKIPLADALPGLEIISMARGESFFVPLDPDRVQGNDPQLVAAWAITSADSIAPRGSWLWTIWRESALTIGGIRGSAGRESARLYGQNTTGPLAHLLILNSPLASGFDADLRGLFAKAALDRLSANAVVDDLKLFYGGTDTTASRAGAILVRSLQRMSPDDVDSLALLLPPRWRAVLIEFAAALRTAPDETPSVAVPRAIKQIWDPTLKRTIEQSLREMFPPPGRGA